MVLFKGYKSKEDYLMPLPLLGAIVARLSVPLIVRAGVLIENKINILGVAAAGALGWVINERNQDKADNRHQEMMKQAERHQKEILAQQAKLNRDLVDAVKTGNLDLSLQMNRVVEGVHDSNLKLVDIGTRTQKSDATLSRIMGNVNKINEKILQCTKATPDWHSLPTRELVLN